jgi:hypothetical protein
MKKKVMENQSRTKREYIHINTEKNIIIIMYNSTSVSSLSLRFSEEKPRKNITFMQNNYTYLIDQEEEGPNAVEEGASFTSIKTKQHGNEHNCIEPNSMAY